MKIIKKNYNSNSQRYTEILCTTLLQKLNFWKSWIVLYAIFIYEKILLNKMVYLGFVRAF